MMFVGIDIAKRKHCASAVDNTGVWCFEDLVFSNDQEGFQILLSALKEQSTDEVKICLEATGHYGLNLIAYLQQEGYEVFEINPILTNNWRKSQSVRKVKNDAVDAKALATWLYCGNTAQLKPMVENRDDLRSLTRFRTSLTGIIGDAKRRAIGVLDRIFPEYHGFFADDFGKTSMMLLKRWPSAHALAQAHIDAIEALLRDISRNHCGREHAEKLKELAERSIGQKSSALEFELVLLLDQISFTASQLEALDAKIAQMIEDSPILTIPGIGVVCAATILAELGDISRFASPAKIVAFAGCDPSVYASGEFEAQSGHISKRGSKYLRRYLWLAADRARIFDPTLKRYYQKKRSEGKCHKVAITAVIRKLCAIIFSVLTRKAAYRQPEESSS